MLKSVELAGFKSFAKKVSLDFTTPVTGVVGPNGSGKSNVAEAFRFVLGEQSMKSMRGKRGEDMIWNGSPAIPRANRASVKITFDNTRKVFTVDFDEVTIERIVHRDGVNEYLLNGSPVRLKDVTELLAAAHIGASGHHIISQGEADRILTASAKERREMIEDALGLKVYHYKRIESERNLEKTETNLKEVASLRRELAPHITFLKKQVARIEKGRALREELVLRYQEYFKREQAYLQAEKKQIETERTLPQKESSALDARIIELKSTLDASDDSTSESKEVIALEERLRTAREASALLSREEGRLEGLLSAEERRLSRLSATDLSAKLVSFSEVHRFAGDIEREADVVTSALDLGVAKEAGMRIKLGAQSFVEHAKGAGVESERKDIETEIARLKTEKSTIEVRVTEASAAESIVKAEYDALRLKMENEKSVGRAAERELFAAMGKRNELSILLSQLKSREDRLTYEEQEYSRELGEAAAVAGRLAIAYELANVPDVALFEPREKQHERRREIEKMKIRVEEMGGAGGDEVVKEFNEASERDAFLAREMADLEKTAASIKQLISDLTIRLASEFDAGLARINSGFTELFGLMFGGGSAVLSVVQIEQRNRKSEEIMDDSIEFSESIMVDPEEKKEPERGIEVAVNLPHKRVRGLDMLSGGERALTSIALLFAISRVNPPPFIILDETDAALDEANSRKYGDLISELAKTSQLILITHNRETMSRAGVLYGVTMGSDGVSRLLSIKFEEAVAVAK